ncbi:hypothetical protein N9383_01230 [Granulosicoccus sp.]|nr:hypothetical protein [Granulosicoccus sp.]
MGPVIYIISWLIFGNLHSVLARQSIQLQLERFLGSYYRLIYNLVALVKISIVLYVGKIWLDDTQFNFLDNNAVHFTYLAIKYLGATVLALAIMTYDIGRFAGITQVITGERVSSSSNEPLQRRFLNRWVRHPLYTGAFLVLWGGAISTFDTWTAILGTLYLLIGTHFEERKLLNIYGDQYRTYQQEVPRYFPSFNFH